MKRAPIHFLPRHLTGLSYVIIAGVQPRGMRTPLLPRLHPDLEELLASLTVKG